MYQVEDEPIETTHLYVMREGSAQPSRAPIVLSLFTLALVIALGIATPYQQPEQRAAIRVPAVPLGIRTFSATITVIPTGVKSYPATYAHGTLTIKNGSVIAQVIPAGFTVANVQTDKAVYVPAGNENGYGIATVPAHLLTSGINLSTLAINQVIGTSVYIVNLSPFTGGHPAYSVLYATDQDRKIALTKAREKLTSASQGLHYPCSETVTSVLTWHCQFVTYHIPSYMRVTGVMIQGENLLVIVVFVERPRILNVK